MNKTHITNKDIYIYLKVLIIDDKYLNKFSFFL